MSRRSRVVAGMLLLLALVVSAGLIPSPPAAPAVTNDAPQVNFQADPRRGDVPLIVHFTNTSSVSSGATASFLWAFGDGATSSQEDPVHTYVAPGKYDVALTVTDDQGHVDLKTARGFITADPPTLVAALLPVSRSVGVGTLATAFVSIINAGAISAMDVKIEVNSTVPPAAPLPLTLTFQATDAAHQPIAPPNVAVDIPPGKAQSFIIGLLPSAPFGPTDVSFDFSGSNTAHAKVVPGLNTLLLSASTEAVPDIVAIAATINANGIVGIPSVPGTGVFSVATVNLGSGGTIGVSADTGGVDLPITLSICQTDPSTSACLGSPAATVAVPFNANDTPTFGIFVTGTGVVPYDPEVNRVFVRFTDGGGVARGATSVAVRTP